MGKDLKVPVLTFNGKKNNNSHTKKKEKKKDFNNIHCLKALKMYNFVVQSIEFC